MECQPGKRPTRQPANEPVRPPPLDRDPQNEAPRQPQLLPVAVEELRLRGDPSSGLCAPLRQPGRRRLLRDFVPPPLQLAVAVADDNLFLKVLVAFGDLAIMPAHFDRSNHERPYKRGGERA